jgi:hypothetical protein
MDCRLPLLSPDGFPSPAGFDDLENGAIASETVRSWPIALAIPQRV